MIKHISQVATLADYRKLAAAAVKKSAATPVRAHFFPRFPFDKGPSPMLLVGEVPPAVLAEVKRRGGPCVIGKAALSKDGKVEFDVASSRRSW